MKRITLCGTILFSTLVVQNSAVYSASIEEAKPIAPRTAIISRQSATIFAKENVRINKGKFSVVLPSSFISDSFVLQTQGMDIMSMEVSVNPIYIKNIPLVQKRAELRKKIEQYTTKINAIDARVAVLSSSQQVFTSAKDVSTLDTALGARFEYLYNQKSAFTKQKDEVTKELQTVERALVQAAGSVEPSYAVLNVTLVNNKIDGDHNISYSYVVNDAGWSPIYQVDADITKKTVSSKFTVEVWQRTALPWDGTNVILTTATPSTSPEPSYLAPWNIGGNKPQPRAKAMMASNSIQTLELYGDSAPIVEFVSNAMQWSLGKQTIVAGETKTITLSTTVFNADFMYTLRPYASNEAFFTAKLKSNKQVTLPGGRASFSVAGLGVGKGTFKYTPNDNNIVYFGKDPLVTGTMELEKDTLTVTKKDQVKKYVWAINVQNRRKTPVEVIVQDMKPETTSPQIMISFEGTSQQPNIESKFVEWTIPALKPNKTEKITYSVTLTAPLDIEIISPR